MKAYWTEKTFGSSYTPINFDEIIAEANTIIGASKDPESTSEQLWETFCMTDTVGNVTAVYEKECDTMQLTEGMRRRGELAVRNLSEQAQAYYYNSDVKVYEFEPDHYIADECGFKMLCVSLDDMNTLFEERAEQADVVVNCNGKAIDYAEAVELMDDELREQLHCTIGDKSKQFFFSAYETMHEIKYGEPWELSKANPVY